MDRIVQDVRIALRGFRRTPTFTVTAVLILGIGIGMAAAMMSVFDAVLVRKLPVREQDRIVLPRVVDRVGVAIDVMDGVGTADSPEQLKQLRLHGGPMRDVAGVSHSDAVQLPLADGDRPILLRRAAVTGNFFDVLGTRPILGRLLRPEDDVAGASPVMVISYAAWQRQFGGDSTIIGRRLTAPWSPLGVMIIGVAPPGLDYPAGAESWFPMAPFGGGMVNVIARLAPNATPTAAAAALMAFMRRDARIAVWVASAHTEVHTLEETVVGDVRPVLVVLLAAVGLLLLIACVNVGNLLLLRAASRTREIAVRRALGATNAAIASQLLVESALLGAAGGALGLACAAGLLRLLLAFAPAQLPRADLVRLAGTPVWGALAVTLIAVLLFGVVPAMAAARGNLASPLRLDSRSGNMTRGRRRVRQALVASQVALAVVMLAGAGLLARTLERLTRVDLGYQADHLAFLSLSAPVSKYGSQKALGVLFDQIAPRFRAIPGVIAITPVNAPPFLLPNLFLANLEPADRPSPRDDENSVLPVEIGGPDYFRTLGIPLRGRAFLETDAEDAPAVVVVSEAVARRFWPGESPIGKRMRYPGDTSRANQRTVVGVAADIRYRRLRQAMPTLYVPWRQFWWSGNLAVRTTNPLATVLPAMRRRVREVDPGLDIWYAHTTDQLLDGPLAQPRLSAMLLSGFAVVALLLAAIGLYGVMASAVREQTRELGVRMALGATAADLRRDVLARALGTIGAGAVLGIAGALTSSRVLSALLFEVSPTDPVTLVGVCLLLFAVALVAAYVPAQRATKVDPAEALRSE